MELINKILKKGESFGDLQVSFLEEDKLKLEYKGNKIDNSEKSKTSVLSIRIINGKKFGFAKTTNLDKWEECLKSAVRIMNASTSLHQKIEIPKVGKSGKISGLVSKKIKDMSEQELFELGEALVNPVMEKNLNIPYAGVEKSLIKNIFANRYGTVQEEYTFFSSGIECNQNESIGTEYKLSHNLHNPAEVGEAAAKLAIETKGFKPADTKKTDLVLDYNAFSSLLNKILVPNLLGDNVATKKSYLADKLNKQMFSEKLSVVDHGNLSGGLFSVRVDAEGTPTGKTKLIDRGTVSNFLSDSYTATLLKTKTTGNCASLEKIPYVGPTNLIVQPGDYSREEILKDTKEGIFANQVMGTHVANEATGDASVGIENAYFIKNGRREHSLKQAMIHINLFDALKKLEVLGNKNRQDSSISAPLVKFSNIQIIG